MVKKNKVIVTGGSGFIGKNLLPYLATSDAHFYLLDICDSIHLQYDNISVVKCNLLDYEVVRKVMKSIKANLLLHLAWGMSPGNYNLPSNFDWLKSSMFLLEEFRINGGERALVVGSGAEYNWDFGYCSEGITPESYETVYGSTKNILRQYAFSYCKHYEIELAWPRLFFIYGPYEDPARLISHVISSLVKGEKAKIMNGEIYRDYMYIKDTVKALSDLLFSNYNGVVNVGTGIPTKLADMGKMAADIIGRPDLLHIELPEPETRKIVYADITELKRAINFKPLYDLHAGLTETINWWKDNI